MTIPLVIPNTISNGIAIDGDDLGANFTAIKGWADDTDTRLDAVEAEAPQAATARFYRTTDIVLGAPTDTEIVTWETVVNDVDGWCDLVDYSVLTCPADGLYLFTLQMNLAAGSGWVYLRLQDGVLGTAGVSDPKIVQVDGDYDLVDVTSYKASGGNAVFMNSGSTIKVQASTFYGSTGRTVDTVNLFITKVATV